MNLDVFLLKYEPEELLLSETKNGATPFKQAYTKAKRMRGKKLTQPMGTFSFAGQDRFETLIRLTFIWKELPGLKKVIELQLYKENLLIL